MSCVQKNSDVKWIILQYICNDYIRELTAKRQKDVARPIIVHIDPADKTCSLAPPSHDLTLSARLLG